MDISQIIDRMAEIKKEKTELDDEYASLQAKLQVVGETALEDTKYKSVSYAGTSSKATVTIADKVSGVMPSLFGDIFGKAFHDLVTEKNTLELNAEGKRIVAAVWNKEYCEGSVEEIVGSLNCDEKAKKSLMKKLNGKNFETDKKNLIIELIGDREHASIYNNMIAKREEEITALEKKIAELKEYDKVCKQRKEQLKNTTQILDEILSEGKISDVNLRMLVNKILIHQNEDKSLDIKFEINGDFNNASSTPILSENH